MSADLHAVTVFAAERISRAIKNRYLLTHAAHGVSYGERSKTFDELIGIVEAGALAEGVLRMLAAGMIPDLPEPTPAPERKRDGRGRYVAQNPQSATAVRSPYGSVTS